MFLFSLITICFVEIHHWKHSMSNPPLIPLPEPVQQIQVLDVLDGLFNHIFKGSVGRHGNHDAWGVGEWV